MPYVLILMSHVYGNSYTSTVIDRYIEQADCVQAGNRLLQQLKTEHYSGVYFVCFAK